MEKILRKHQAMFLNFFYYTCTTQEAYPMKREGDVVDETNDNEHLRLNV